MKLFLNTLFKIVMLVILLTIITPVLYFAWRMGQPLSHPEFKGLTYYQFIEWREMAYHDREVDYQNKHPDANVKFGMCETGHRTLTIGVLALQSGTYTLAGLRGIPPRPSYPFPEDVTLGNFLSKWWDTYEYLFWYNEIHLDSLGSGPPGSICIIRSGIPTTEEFEAMKLIQTANSSASQ